MTSCRSSLRGPTNQPDQDANPATVYYPDCESAPKWDPFSSPGKHLIPARKFVRGGVRVGADRDPCWSRAFSVRSATYAEISWGPTSVLIHRLA
jgi:hypothetical protein